MLELLTIKVQHMKAWSMEDVRRNKAIILSQQDDWSRVTDEMKSFISALDAKRVYYVCLVLVFDTYTINMANIF